MESVLQCDSFGSFDYQQNETCFSSILDDFQDRTQLDYGFNFPSETLEFTETSGTSCAPKKTAVGEKRKLDNMDSFWDSEYFLSSNDCNFVGTYANQDFSSLDTAADSFEIKALDNCSFSLDDVSTDLCTADHVYKKQKIDDNNAIPVIPNISSPPFSSRPNSSPSSPQKTSKRRSRDLTRRSTPIPILCPDTLSSVSPISSDPTLIPHICEFRKTISELDDTTRNVYRDTLLQLAHNAEQGVFEPSSQNNGLNFESLLMRMMFSFSVPSISPSYFHPSAVDRSHLIANQSFYNNLQFVPIITPRSSPSSPSIQPFRADTKIADPFFSKPSFSVPNYTIVKPFPLSSSLHTASLSRANDSKQPILSRHLPIRVL